MKQNLKTQLMKRMAPMLAQAPYFRGAGLLLSVSGGVDSMALLDVFHRMSHVHQTPLRVCHINHHTGPHAHGAQELVTQYCQNRNIPLQVSDYHWDGCGNFEYEAARFRRETLAANLDQGWAAVIGHHLQDQAETMIQTLMRGAGIASRLGMDPIHGNRLRPFLDVDRSLILDHAASAGVPHVLDPSNHDTQILRNHVRHQIMPELESRYGGTAKRLAAFADEHRALRHALEEEAHRHFQKHYRNGLLDRVVFNQTPPYLWDFILKHFWDGHEKPKNQEHQRIRQWLAAGETGTIHMRNHHFYCDLDGLILEPGYTAAPRKFTTGAPTDWGPWRLCIDMPGACEQGKLFQPQKNTKPIREYMRSQRLPHRLRAILPAIQLGQRHYHFLDPWRVPECPLRIQILAGPNPNLEPTGS